MLIMYSFFDTKVGAYGAPFFFAHIGQARRAVSELVTDPANMIGRYPADFQLHQLGTFDDGTGAYVPELVNLGAAVTFMPPPRNVLPLFENAESAIVPTAKQEA